MPQLLAMSLAQTFQSGKEIELFGPAQPTITWATGLDRTIRCEKENETPTYKWTSSEIVL